MLDGAAPSTVPPRSSARGPALARHPAQELVRVRVVGDAHVRGVVGQLLPSAQRDDAEEHDFGQLGGVLERARRRHMTLGGLDPVHLVQLVGHPRQRAGGVPADSWSDFGSSRGLEP